MLLERYPASYNLYCALCRLYVVAEDLAKIVPGDRGALGIPTDITKAEDVAALAAQVLEKFEDVDVVVNNAGVCLTGPFSATAGEDFRSQMDVVRRMTGSAFNVISCCIQFHMA